MRDQTEGKSNDYLRDFFENAAIGLHWVGPDGIVLRVNQAELDLLGYSRDFDEHLVKPPSLDQMRAVLSHRKLAAKT